MNQTEIRLPADSERIWLRNIKIGILKELRRENMLTDFQLEQLIQMQNN